MQKNDLVIIQFGHNDNGPTAPLKGVGDDTEERSGETVHSWGWYMRAYIAEARAENVPLLDLYQRIADRYDPMGEPAVTALFADKRVHTGKAGAELNAAIVVEALNALSPDPPARFLKPRPDPLW